jgi:hypothetical protein
MENADNVTLGDASSQIIDEPCSSVMHVESKASKAAKY